MDTLRKDTHAAFQQINKDQKQTEEKKRRKRKGHNSTIHKENNRHNRNTNVRPTFSTYKKINYILRNTKGHIHLGTHIQGVYRIPCQNCVTIIHRPFGDECVYSQYWKVEYSSEHQAGIQNTVWKTVIDNSQNSQEKSQRNSSTNLLHAYHTQAHVFNLVGNKTRIVTALK